MNAISYWSRQRGATLFTALIMLIAVTLLSLAALGTSLLELRMAGNANTQASAFQMAQAAIDNVLNDPSANFLVQGVGITNCNYSGCNLQTVLLTAPAASAVPPVQVKIQQLTAATCPPRGAQTSCVMEKAATFNADSLYNATAAAGGYARVDQGYITLIPQVGGAATQPPSGSYASN